VALAEIAKEEKKRAQRWQRQAEINEPVKTGFKPAGKLDPALNAALERLWKLDGTDQNLRRLYFWSRAGRRP
jgi:hypothetical protein